MVSRLFNALEKLDMEVKRLKEIYERKNSISQFY